MDEVGEADGRKWRKRLGVDPIEARPTAEASAADEQALNAIEADGRKWRKRLGVEPSLPRKEAATDFEDREGHRAPFTSVARSYQAP